MNNNPVRILSLVATFVLLASLFTGCTDQKNNNAIPTTNGGPSAENVSIRLGWQPPWANQGQIVQVFKHTDVLVKSGVKVEYKPFSYGGPMNEAALAGELDILFEGDQPALTLMSRSPKWKIVARMVNYRSAFVTPLGSSIKSVSDLRGKTVATAFGSTTHRDAVRILREHGLVPGRDLTLVNVDQAEHAALIARGGGQKWGNVDAIATYDPTVAIAVEKNQAKVVQEWASPGVVVASDEFITKRSAELKNFLKAYIEAYATYSATPGKFDELYATESRLTLPMTLYKSLAKFEPNMSVKAVSKVNIVLSDEQQKAIQHNAEVALQMGILKKSVDVNAQIEQRQAEAAQKEIRAQ